MNATAPFLYPVMELNWRNVKVLCVVYYHVVKLPNLVFTEVLLLTIPYSGFLTNLELAEVLSPVLTLVLAVGIVQA